MSSLSKQLGDSASKIPFARAEYKRLKREMMDTKARKDEKEKTSSGKNDLNLSVQSWIRFEDYFSMMMITKRASRLARVFTDAYDFLQFSPQASSVYKYKIGAVFFTPALE